MIPTGRWEISSRLPGAKYSYRGGSLDSIPEYIDNDTPTLNKI